MSVESRGSPGFFTSEEYEITTYTVSELNSIVRGMLETRLGEIHLRGEISNLSQPSSGHRYFTLKDDKSQIRCAFFKNRSFGLGFKPANGQEVIAIGRVSLYEARGDYQMIVERLESAGEGQLQVAFEKLKIKLHSEGLFDPALKRPLPKYPKQIAIITSATGAALQDILHVLERRYPLVKVLLFPVAVQGDSSESELVSALLEADATKGTDVILLSRGGGSIEDLWSFNNEALARHIVETRIPVVTGIGHEIDFTIADFAADQRAPTPSAAAELLTPSSLDILDKIAALRSRIVQNQVRMFNDSAQSLDRASTQLLRSHPARRLSETLARNTLLGTRVLGAISQGLGSSERDFATIERRLKATSPGPMLDAYRDRLRLISNRLEQSHLKKRKNDDQRLSVATRMLKNMAPDNTLSRGYAIVRTGDEKTIVRSAEQLQAGERFSVLLSKGSLTATATSILSEE